MTDPDRYLTIDRRGFDPDNMILVAAVRNFNEDLLTETVDDLICLHDGGVLEVPACDVCRADYHRWTGRHLTVQNGSVLRHVW